MVVEEIVLAIKSIFDDAGWKQASSRIEALRMMSEKVGKPIWEVESAFRRTGMEIIKVGKSGVRVFDTYSKGFISWEEAQDRVTKATTRFKMHLLSIMFFGMMLKRVFLGFLESAIATYMKVTEGQTAAGKAMLRMQASWEFFKFSIVEALSGLIIWFSTLTVNILDFLSAHPALMKFIGGFATLLGVFGAIIAPVAALGLGLAGLKTTFEGLMLIPKIFDIIGAAATFLMANPVILAIALIIAAVALLYLAWTNNWFGIRDKLKAVWDFLVSIFGPIVDWLRNIITGALGFLQNVWNEIWGAIGPYAVAIWDWMKDMWNITWNFIKSILGSAWSVIKSIFGLIFDVIFKLVEKISDFLAPIWEAVWESLVEVFNWVGEKISWVWNNVIKPVLDALIGFLNQVKAVYDATLGAIAGVAARAAAAVTGAIGGARVAVRAMQEGGFITTPTLAMLHPGETVVPAGGAPVNISLSPVYNINGVGNADELRRLLAEHDRNLMLEISRVKIPGV